MAAKPSPKPSKTKKALPKPNAKLKKSDYLYALEVAGQPAASKADKAMKRQAKADMKYLESKFPKYTAKVKNTGTRVNMPEWNGKPKTPKAKKK